MGAAGRVDMVLSIRVSPEGQEAFKAGTHVSLHATADGNPDSVQWVHKGVDLDGETDMTLDISGFTAAQEGEYKVRAKYPNREETSAAVTLKLAPAEEPDQVPPPAAPSTPAEVPPTFHPDFATAALLVTVAVGVAGLLLLTRFVDARFSDEDWADLAGNLQVALSSFWLLVVIGTIVALVGVWMALVEWRGRFQELPDKTRPKGLSGDDLSKVIDSIGKLRGSAAVPCS
jgi:hypothetical protein